MVNANLTINLFAFQEEAVASLLDFATKRTAKQTITLKAPTGAGKTVLLIGFLDSYLTHVGNDVAFIWLCPGKGNLEEQSRSKMQRVAPNRLTQNLFDALSSGFSRGSTTFINWELVTKTGNTAIRDSERKNLFDRIAEAHRSGINFFIIIDEEHSNNTAKAKNIINAFAAKHIVRVSATAIRNARYEFIEIDEQDVINEGLITKALYVNEGIANETRIDNDYDLLLTLADEKRKAIAARYREQAKTIRPLVLIQFPNGQPQTVEAVENKLAAMGYTYDNGMVSKWMSEDKRELTNDLTENDGQPVFLLMKQAISTGWDCPRAKILVKLREGMSETFEIQTIGRIRRMPEAHHYDDDLLDFCYVYTLDERYKEGLFAQEDHAYETRRLFLKSKCKTFALEKQTRDLDFEGLGEREIMKKLRDFLCNKYRLSNNKLNNQRLLAEKGYIFGSDIIGQVLHGEYVHASMLATSEKRHVTRRRVNTHAHGMQLMHSIDALKSAAGLSATTLQTILKRTFCKGASKGSNLIDLSLEEFYAFAINNEHLLRQEFRDVTSGMLKQLELKLNPKTTTFHIPEQDFYRYDPGVKNEVEYLSNAYEDYTSGYATSLVRSTCEMLFEQYCEQRDDIDWVYKNGDTGQQYFSIVYLDALQKQRLFYADYIVRKKDGTIWVIETKGGEIRGQNKNIDNQIANKFIAFKNYATEKKLCWGFVRDKDNQLYINNTDFSIDLSDHHWVPLADEF